MAAAADRPLAIEIHGARGSAIDSDRVRLGRWPGVRFHGVRVAIARPPYGGLHALQGSLEGFRSWVQEGVPYLTAVRAALPVLPAVEILYKGAHVAETAD